ncbi:MAG: hypothetical protein ABII22_02680 [Candidatus Micrarchaeota archaeon]
MEFDELLVTTGVDKLVRLVKEKQKIELEMAAKILKIEIEQVEDWAKVLDEEGIIRVDYYLTKVYLSWVKPTEKEVEKETQAIYREKASVKTKVAELKDEIEPEIKSLEKMKKTFDDFYEKIYPKIKKIEGSLGANTDIKTILEKKYEDYEFKKQELEDKLQIIENSNKELKGQVQSIKSEIKGKGGMDNTKMDSLRKEIKGIKTEVTDIEEKIDEARKMLPKEMQKLDFTKKLDKLKLEFKDLAKNNFKVKEDMRNLTETAELSQSIADAIKTHEKRTESMKKEMQGMLKTMGDVQKRSAEMLEEIKGDADTVERFADSIDVAKDIMKKFPSQKEVNAKVAELESKENDLGEKMEAMEKLLSEVSGPIDILKEFKTIQKKAEDIRNQIIAESEEVFRAVEEEGSTYATFQKIKERTLGSLEAYSTQLSEIEEDVQGMKKELSKGIDAEIENYRKKLQKGEIGDIGPLLKNIEEIKNKKDTIDEIKYKIDETVTLAGNLTRKLNMLSKQAEMLSIRSSGALGSEEGITEDEVANEITLTREEETEFRKKREELKGLIKKLWEEES